MAAKKKSRKKKGDHTPLFWLAILAVLAFAVYFIASDDLNIYKKRLSMDKVPTSPTFTITEQNNSGINGEASLNSASGKTTVTLSVDGASTTTTHPAHIHNGTCEDLGDIAYPLNEVENGSSVTIIDATITELRAQEPLAINLHRSPTQLSEYVACTNLSL